MASRLQILPIDCQRLIWSKVFNECLKDIPTKVEYNKLNKEYNQCINEIDKLNEKIDETYDWEERNDLLLEYDELKYFLEEIKIKISTFYDGNNKASINNDYYYEYDDAVIDDDDKKLINGYAFIRVDDVDDSDDELILSSDDEQ